MPNNQDTVWPLPTFRFIVKIEDEEIHFQEVSGLDTEYDVIEYRAGNSAQFAPVKMPGLKKSADITLKKGMFKDNPALFDYLAAVKMNAVVRKTVTIALIDEENKALFVWTLKNAFPKKVSGASINAKTTEVAIEELVLAHDGLTMAKG